MSVQVAKSLSSLASVLNDMERYEEAESAYRESLSIREDALGENNVQVGGKLSLGKLVEYCVSKEEVLYNSFYTFVLKAQM